MTDSAKASPISISVIVLLCGDLLRAEYEAGRLLTGLDALAAVAGEKYEWILAIDGPQWAKVIAPSAWEAAGERRTAITLARTSHHPGVLANHALMRARGEYVVFLWPGCRLERRVEIWDQLRAQAANDGVALAGGRRSRAESRQSLFDAWLPHEADQIPGYASGWLEMQSIIPMSNAVVRRSAFEEGGGFSPSALLQRHFWWEFALRLARQGHLSEVRTPEMACRWGWHDYPLQNGTPVSADLAARLLASERLPVRGLDDGLEVNSDGLSEFTVDLEESRASRLIAQSRSEWVGVSGSSAHRSERPLRVTLLGGLNEPAHMYFCFSCFFHRLAGEGVLNWRVVHDLSATPADLLDSDLVIFNRTRSENGRKLMDFCAEREIPTIFLLNDNWFWLARDRPEEYGDAWLPGRPAYENFLHCCRSATAVMTQNALIEEDVRPYARRVLRVDPSIELSIFDRPARRKDERLRVGFIGSPRWEEGPYRALHRVARRHSDLQVYVMSARFPEALRDLPSGQVLHRRNVFDYRLFARLCSADHPDILLAPLEQNRSQASKCPNKYFDITGVGAAGIYSNLPPYSSFIRHEENGLMAGSEADEWEASLERLIADAPLRDSIVRAAREDIQRRHATELVLPRFLEAIMSVARAERGASEIVSV